MTMRMATIMMNMLKYFDDYAATGDGDDGSDYDDADNIVDDEPAAEGDHHDDEEEESDKVLNMMITLS